MIYTKFKDWILNHKKGDLLRCNECGMMTDTVFAFWKVGDTDRCICHNCVNRHYKNRDTGIYPVEKGMGMVSSTMLLFDDWSVFFDSGCHRKYRWKIVEYRNGRLWMQEIDKDDGWSTLRYELIATEKMIQDFDKVIQSGGE